VKKDLHHELYKQCLFDRIELKHRQVCIRSHVHQIGVYEQKKTSLSPLDTKKYNTINALSTKAFDHYNMLE
jgi:hypothetical protein